MKYSPILFIFFLVFFACTSEQSTDPATDVADDTTVLQAPPVQNKTTLFTVGIDHLRIRDEAGEKGKEIAMLKKGAILYDTGEVSDFTTRIKLRGIWYDEPWIKIRTDHTGVEGWVYAGGLVFEMENPTELSTRLLDIRLKSFFGNQITKDLHAYRSAYYSASTSEDFATVFRQGEMLRDTLVGILEKKIDVYKLDYDKLPDLFWVEEGLPGYETALAAEGTIYYLFQNFKKFRKLAGKTTGKEDDDFIYLNLKVHAVDSIEHFFPAWFLQTWDYGGHSLLGQGKHLSILKTADLNLKKSPLFLDETVGIKDWILDDITLKENTFWEPIDKIKKELDQILAEKLSILTSEDKIALETRRQQFNDPNANKIEVNQRAGLEE